jgi:hypothetical protein
MPRLFLFRISRTLHLLITPQPAKRSIALASQRPSFAAEPLGNETLLLAKK